MADDHLRLSTDLEEVRRILYADLAPAEGQRRIEEVFDVRAARRELIEDLFRRVRHIVDDQD